MAKVNNTIEKVWARIGKDIQKEEKTLIGNDIVEYYDVFRDITLDPNDEKITFDVVVTLEKSGRTTIGWVTMTVFANRVVCYYKSTRNGLAARMDSVYYGNTMLQLCRHINDELKKF